MDHNPLGPGGWRGYPCLDLAVMGLAVVGLVAGWWFIANNQAVPADLNTAVTSAIAVVVIRVLHRLGA